MKTIRDFFYMPDPKDLEILAPLATYRVIGATEPLPITVSPEMLAIGMQEQDFIVVDLLKVTSSSDPWLVERPSPVRKTVFSKAHKGAFDLIMKWIEKAGENVDWWSCPVKFGRCREISVESKIPYIPTRVDRETREITEAVYLKDSNTHKAGDKVLSFNHKLFLFDGDSLLTELGRRMSTANWQFDNVTPTGETGDTTY